MTYRLLADENVERATITYLRTLGHDVEWLGTVDDLGLGAMDEAIARTPVRPIAVFARRTTTS